jgi:hypothetical protein
MGPVTSLIDTICRKLELHPAFLYMCGDQWQAASCGLLLSSGDQSSIILLKINTIVMML